MNLQQQSIALIARIYPSIIWKIKVDSKKLFLSFDDGPTPGVTELVLDLLASFDAKATFFCLAKNVEKYPELYKRILNEGHEIGNHTFNHLNGWKSDNKKYLRDVNLASTKINSSFFRPPYGKMKPKQVKLVEENFSIIMWSILTKDYDQSDWELCNKKMLDKLEPGAIAVFHDSEKAKDKMLFLLENILRQGRKEDYTFDKIREEYI